MIYLILQVPDPLPVKLDNKADQGLAGVPPAPINSLVPTVGDITGARTGAVNPEPITQMSGSPKLAPISPKPLDPIKPSSAKPRTPQSAKARTPLNWPRPGSRTSPNPVVENATTNAAVAGTLEPELARLTPKSPAPVNWPSPSAEPPKIAA